MSVRNAAKIAVLYATFAGLAMAANLGVQWAVTEVWPWRFGDLSGLAAGTAAGLVLKYLLDKRWIFRVRTAGLLDDAHRFVYYTVTGVATTAIFWGTELGFLAVFGSEPAKYIGAAIGLAAGYTTKYFLDARFVFRSSTEPGSASSTSYPIGAVEKSAFRLRRSPRFAKRGASSERPGEQND